MVGQGMWFNKGSKPKLKKDLHLKIFSFSELFRKQREYEELIEETLELNAALKKLQPKDRIKIKINNISDIPDCHYPHQIIQTHVRRAEAITDFVFCAQDCRIQTLPRCGDQIKVSLLICATQKICARYYRKKGCIKKFEHQLYIVPPQIEHKFVTCLIEHPIDKEFKLERIDFEEFKKRFEKEPSLPLSDSSDSDFLSSDEEGKQE